MSALPTEAGKCTPPDWRQVHVQIQSLLKALVDRVQEQLPTVRSDGGTTASQAFPLFSYRSFRWPHEEGEAVLAGLEIVPAPDGLSVLVRGDIGGEETGRTYYEAEERVVSDTPPAVLAAARAVASELSRQAEVVVQALHERRQPPNYRNLRSHGEASGAG